MAENGGVVITDTGTDANGVSWVRYSNGVMEQWGVTSSLTCSTADGVLFRSNTGAAVTFTYPFTATPTIFVSVPNTSLCGGRSVSQTSTGTSFQGLAATSGNSGTLNWLARGRWF